MKKSMSAINFNFNKAADPLLGQGIDYTAQFTELDNAQRTIEQRKQALLQLAQHAEEQTKPASPTPIWDEIDAITGNMSPSEYQAMFENAEFQKSLGALQEYVGAVQLQMIRPHVEQSAEGKKILEQHLTTVKFLRKAAFDQANKTLADFKDYTENYGHMSWDEYLKTKGGHKK